jgi:hypothetical protein
MPSAKGFLTKLALAREAITYTPAWPAAQPATPPSLLPLLSEDLQESYDAPPRMPVGRATTRPGTRRSARAGGPVRLQATYDGMELVWALALGAMAYRVDGVALPEELTTGVFRHLYECAEALHSTGWPAGCGAVCGTDTLVCGQQQIRRATAVVDKQVSCWEFLSGMVGSLDLDAAPAGVSVALALAAHSLDRDSATNPNLDALSDPDSTPIAFTDLELRIGPYSTETALDASDAYDVAGVRLSLDNALRIRSDVASGLHIAEPKRRGPVQVSGELFIPRYESDQFLNWLADETELMASLVMTGPAIAATGYDYTLRLWLPCVRLHDAPAPTTGDDEHALRVALAAYAPLAAPAGFPATWLTGPLCVECVSANDTHPLL